MDQIASNGEKNLLTRLLLLQALTNDQRQLVSPSCCLIARRYRKISTWVAPVASAMSGIPPGSGRVAPDAAQTSPPTMIPRHRCNVRRCARLKRSGPVSGSRPSNAAAAASGSSGNRPRTSHRTSSKGPFRVRQVRGAHTPGSRPVRSCSSRHWPGSLARRRFKLWPRGVGLSSGDTSAAWDSLIACSNATGSKVALRSSRAAFASALTTPWRVTRPQGVAGGLQRWATTEPLRGFSRSLKDGWKQFTYSRIAPCRRAMVCPTTSPE